MKHRYPGRLCAALAAVLIAGSAVQASVTIETVHVGDIGNTADTAAHSGNDAGQGQVNYTYNIGKYEVTAGQYMAFLNAVADTDTYALYNTAMLSDTASGSGIARSGGGTLIDPYTYTVDSAFVNRPVNYVSFWDAARFANWLSNGQPTGAQGSSTTEDGTYTLTSGGISGNTIIRNANATWVVASEDEWYKAAYYKGGSTSAGYYLYPTGSDTAPGQDMGDSSGNNANYYTAPNTYPIDSGKYTTVAGEFQNSDSPYGAFDQGGNVWEWNEAVIDGSYRGLRGGSFGTNDVYLQSSNRDNDHPTSEGSSLGFRVSLVPEPGSIVLLALGVGGMLVRRRGDGR